MFLLSLPLSVKVGDTVDCTINGQPKQVTWRDTETLVIEPDDARTVIDVHDDGKLRYFTCGDRPEDGGVGGISIIRPGE